MDRRYAPRPLSTSWEYPGYQFYAVLRNAGHDSAGCLRYAALTVQNWLCERIQMASGSIPEEIRCVPAAQCLEIEDGYLKSVKLPFSEIISLPEQGIWTLVVREPHPQIAARSFVTHVGLRVRNDEEVEFGVFTDIVDRDSSLPEQDKAFRPQFVRLLFETEGMTLTQVEPLPFRQYTSVTDKRGMARLKAMADNRENQLPLIVFTHARPLPASTADMERFFAEMMKLPAMPGFGMSAPPFSVAQKQDCFMPYDAQEFSRHVYGFARAYVVSETLFSELRA